jgi:predicted nucleic acid-binding protein
MIVPGMSEQPVVIRDPKDMHILAAALAERCEIIVTGDKDLLELAKYKGIHILTPAEFIGGLRGPVTS